MILIERETPADQEEIYELVKLAFATAEHSDGTEHALVNRLRGCEAYLPMLSLKAVENGKIVGHVLFTKIGLGESNSIALAPLAVDPACQRKGIGSLLMQEGHQIAREMGFDFSVVLGSAHYYPRAGYLPASSFGIFAPFDVPDQNFMALRLHKDALNPNATVVYAKEFFQS